MTLTPQPAPNEKRKLHILCADNNTALGNVLARLFATAGHHVEHVTDGLDAWERLAREIGHYDVVITDHKMPGLNGDELVDLLRQANYPGRVIVHSASLTPREQQRFRELRVDHVVVKSAPAEELLAIVEAFHGS
jgi:CheY-like chemotaxis protein